MRNDTCGYILRVIDTEGPLLIKSDSERLKAITDFPTPRNKTKLRRFPCLKMQVHAWIPGLNWICKELHQLMSETVAWNWMEVHEAEFQETKEAIAE